MSFRSNSLPQRLLVYHCSSHFSGPVWIVNLNVFIYILGQNNNNNNVARYSIFYINNKILTDYSTFYVIKNIKSFACATILMVK